MAGKKRAGFSSFHAPFFAARRHEEHAPPAGYGGVSPPVSKS